LAIISSAVAPPVVDRLALALVLAGADRLPLVAAGLLTLVAAVQPEAPRIRASNKT